MKKKRKRNKREAEINKKSFKGNIILMLIITVIASLLFYFFYNYAHDRSETRARESSIELFESKAARLKEVIFSDRPVMNRIRNSAEVNDGLANYVIFLSISDSIDRAAVISATGVNPDIAWNNVVGKTVNYLNENPVEPLWVKADVVDMKEKANISDVTAFMKNFRSYFFRLGISFDDNFDTAFLETELNGNGLINYEDYQLELGAIDAYLDSFGRDQLNEIPDEMVLFSTIGWFCDEESEVHSLYPYQNNGYNVGRRVIEGLTKEILEEIIGQSTEWLIGEIQEDGSFAYGYYPFFGRQMTHYNLLRHTVSIQPLIWYYAMTGREDIILAIEKTIGYLVDGNIEYRDNLTAYVVDRPNDEIKLGGNAIAIIVLKEYMDVFETDKYKDLCSDLGRGIIELMDRDRGTYFHVLNTDFSRKDQYRTIYYDGEATYALALLYELTGDETWLDAARAGIENFIREDYTKHRDHWVAYALNEVTRHVDDDRYYEFALRNVQENIDQIYYRDTTYHTYLELLMASYEIYRRIDERDISLDYMEKFDEEFFLQAILHRAEHMLNGYLYPEYSMYLSYPERYTGTFMIRHDAFRIRIDDVEHFIAGYYNLWRHYDQIAGD